MSTTSLDLSGQESKERALSSGAVTDAMKAKKIQDNPATKLLPTLATTAKKQAPVFLSIENTPSDQKGTPTCYAHAMAPQIHQALKGSRKFRNRQHSVPSVDEIREQILAWFPPGLQGALWNFHDISDAMPRMYPLLVLRAVDEKQAYGILVEKKRPVQLHYSANCSVGTCIEGLFRDRPGRNLVLTTSWLRDLVKSYEESLSARGGSPERRRYHAVLLTGYDPSTGVCTFLNSRGSGWGDNGHFRVENMDVFRCVPGATLRFFDIYDPGPVSFPRLLSNVDDRNEELSRRAAQFIVLGYLSLVLYSTYLVLVEIASGLRLTRYFQ